MPNTHKRMVLTLTLTGRVEQSGDYWAARAIEFGITSYGKSEDEAQDRLHKAVDVLLSHLLRKGADTTRERLNRLSVEHLLIEEGIEPQSRTVRMPIVRRELVPA